MNTILVLKGQILVFGSNFNQILASWVKFVRIMVFSGQNSGNKVRTLTNFGLKLKIIQLGS